MQVLRGGSDDLLKSLCLQRDPAEYAYTSQGAAVTLVCTCPMRILVYEHTAFHRLTIGDWMDSILLSYTVCTELLYCIPMNNITMRNVPYSFFSFSQSLSFSFSKSSSQASNNDSLCHKAVMAALKVIGFTAEEISSIYKILSTILHLVSPTLCALNIVFYCFSVSLSSVLSKIDV